MSKLAKMSYQPYGSSGYRSNVNGGAAIYANGGGAHASISVSGMRGKPPCGYYSPVHQNTTPCPPKAVLQNTCGIKQNTMPQVNQAQNKFSYNSLVNYKPKYLCGSHAVCAMPSSCNRPVYNGHSYSTTCIRPSQINANCPPPIVPSKLPCPAPPNPDCTLKFPKTCAIPDDLCLPDEPPCPTFETLLWQHILFLILLSDQTKYGDEKLAESSKEDLEINVTQMGNLLGPTWADIFRIHVSALEGVILARLGKKGKEERKVLLDRSIDRLRTNRRTIFLFYKSMDQLCGNEKLLCCIQALWDRHIDYVIGFIEALEEEGMDSDAYNEAAKSAFTESIRFGRFLDSLCLKPVKPCPGEDLSNGYHGSDKLSSNSSSKGKPSPSKSVDMKNELVDLPQVDDSVKPTPSKTNTRGTEIQPVGASIRSPARNITKNVKLIKKTSPDYLEDARFPKPKANQMGVPRRVNMSIIDATILNAKSNAVTVSDTDLTKKQKYNVLDLSGNKLQIGLYGVGKSAGNVLLYGKDAWDDFDLFPINGDATLEFSLEFEVEWRVKNNTKDSIKRPTTNGNNISFSKDKFSVKASKKLTANESEGDYTITEQTQNGKKFFVEIKIEDIPADETRKGYKDTGLYGISRIAIFFPGDSNSINTTTTTPPTTTSTPSRRTLTSTTTPTRTRTSTSTPTTRTATPSRRTLTSTTTPTRTRTSTSTPTTRTATPSRRTLTSTTTPTRTRTSTSTTTTATPSRRTLTSTTTPTRATTTSRTTRPSGQTTRSRRTTSVTGQTTRGRMPRGRGRTSSIRPTSQFV